MMQQRIDEQRDAGAHRRREPEQLRGAAAEGGRHGALLHVSGRLADVSVRVEVCVRAHQCRSSGADAVTCELGSWIKLLARVSTRALRTQPAAGALGMRPVAVRIAEAFLKFEPDRWLF